MSELIGFNPEEKKDVAPPQGELKKIDESYPYEITPDTLKEDGVTFYLGQEARITIERDENSPTGLSVYSPFTQERHTALKPGLNWVGRSKDCDIIIDLSTVSRMHTSINVQQESIYVSDNDSLNGTRVEI